MANARHPQEDADLRPLLPRRNFYLGSWFGRLWSPFRRDAVDASQGDVESSSVSTLSTSIDVAPVAAENSTSTPPVPPNTPPELTYEPADVTSAEERLAPAESSWMAAAGSSSISDSLQRFIENVKGGPSGGPSSSSSGLNPGGQEKLCLICLEPLTQEDFENGSAMALQCRCKGDSALRHKDCAQKWVNVKGSRTCDVCCTTIENLNEPPPRSEAGSHAHSDEMGDGVRGPFPNANDVFDCIRMTWVITIVCILFFGIKIHFALITGLIVAAVYTWSCHITRCSHQYAMAPAARTGPRDQIDAFDGERLPHQHHVPTILVV